MQSRADIACLVLAGGFSSRMQEFKPLLPLGTGTVIEAAVNNIKNGGVSDIRVVTGHRAAELEVVLNSLGVSQVFNPHYQCGMFSSILAGVKTLGDNIEAVLLLPGDIPLVKRHTIKRLIREYLRSGRDVVYPVIGGKRGHPPLISKKCFGDILSGNLSQGLRPILANYEMAAVEVEVLDEGILTDMDTPADYQTVIKRFNDRDIPSVAECYVLLAKAKTPAQVVAHSSKVAEVAGKIACRLSQAGVDCIEDMVTAAGLLHDIAKGQHNHANKGASVLKRLGYSRIAAIVAAHTDIDYAGGQVPDEAAVLYLADKLVLQDKTVALAERFKIAMKRYGADSQARIEIERRCRSAQLIERQIAAVTGLPIAKILGQES